MSNAIILMLCAVIAAMILFGGRHDYRNQCVVCHPSGKLAMWGECE